MELLVALALLGLGVALLLVGVDLFSKHATRAARALHVTIFAVALLFAGAELEELVTAVVASARRSPAIALGDFVGANITNATLALGLAAVMTPITVERAMLKLRGVILFTALPTVAFLLNSPLMPS